MSPEPNSKRAVHEQASLAEPEELLPGDTYEDGPYLVFTAQYHLRRGSCCHSGCRHCPYGEAQNDDVNPDSHS